MTHTPAILGSLKTSDKESIITLGGDIRFGRGLKRWKAKPIGFPTLQTASKTEITTQSYDCFFVRGFQTAKNWGRSFKACWGSMLPTPGSGAERKEFRRGALRVVW